MANGKRKPWSFGMIAITLKSVSQEKERAWFLTYSQFQVNFDFFLKKPYNLMSPG